MGRETRWTTRPHLPCCKIKVDAWECEAGFGPWEGAGGDLPHQLVEELLRGRELLVRVLHLGGGIASGWEANGAGGGAVGISQI